MSATIPTTTTAAAADYFDRDCPVCGHFSYTCPDCEIVADPANTIYRA